MAELLCPKHGPYDSKYETCPVCSGAANRPQQPPPLSEDDMETDLGAGAPQARAAYAAEGGGSEDETDIPRNKANRKFLDIDDEEETQMGRFASGDETELEPVPGSAAALGILWMKEGHRRGQILKIKDGATVGRKNVELVLDDPKVSATHAKFKCEDDDFVIWDLASANGTYVNGKRIRAATVLKENDLVKIGDSIFVVKLLDTPKPKAKTAPKKTAASKKAAATRKNKVSE